MSIIEKAVAKLGDWTPGSNRAPGSDMPGTPVAVAPLGSEADVALDEGHLSEVADGSGHESQGERTLRYEEIDLNRLKEAGMVTPDGTRTQIFEEFRLIKRPLLFVIYWLACLGFTLLSFLIAVYDMRVIRKRVREEKRSAFNKAFSDIVDDENKQ